MQVKSYALGVLQTNCYLLTDTQGQCVLIDTGDDAARIQNALQTLGLEPAAILLTHGHYDHTAGVELLRRAYQIPVYIHEADVPMMQDSSANLGDWLSEKPFMPIQAWQTIQDGDRLQFGQMAFQVLHTPGHTRGSVCFLCEEMLFSGDTLFKLSRGRTDFPGGSDRDMMHSLCRLAKLDEQITVYPGHGEPTTIGFECANNENIIRSLMRLER